MSALGQGYRGVPGLGLDQNLKYSTPDKVL